MVQLQSVFPEEKSIDRVDDHFSEPSKTSGSKNSARNPKVLRYDWQSVTLAEPRDNINFRPPYGNLHKSTYQRLGPEQKETWMSETNERLRDIKSKDDYVPIYPRRRTLNLFSYDETEDDERKMALESSGLKLYPEDYGSTDYRTTSRTDYPLHHPMKPWPISSEDEPWLFFRRTISYTDGELSNRYCNSKYYDEDMDVHNKIAMMKIERYKSYDPITKKFTTPDKLAKYKMLTEN